MFCESCGAKNPYDAEVCIKCGSDKLIKTQTFQAWKASWHMMGTGQQVIRIGCATIVILFLIGYLMSKGGCN